MPRGPGSVSRPLPAWPAALACAVLAVLVSCAGPGGPGSARFSAERHHYPPPGPPGDPWGPYISEAALRFGVPQQWIRAVMRQESGGREDATSSAGAMGLMQLMPDTYALLRAQYGLGSDPYEPHDNIMAGAAYIREQYDKYGAPGFLAAYNAGPRRLDSYLALGTPLPDETVGYLSSVAPQLGAGTQMTGPLAVYAGNIGTDARPPVAYAMASPPAVRMVAATGARTCDPDAAYDPARPCAPAAVPYRMAIAAPRPAPLAAAAPLPVCDPDAAYDPDRPCAPMAPSPRTQLASSASAASPPHAPAFEPPHRAVLPPLIYRPAPAAPPRVQLASLGTGAAAGSWAIQVGAFSSPSIARAAAEGAQRSVPDLLDGGTVEAPATSPFGGAVLFRARVVALSETSASAACARLAARGQACIAVPPGR